MRTLGILAVAGALALLLAGCFTLANVAEYTSFKIKQATKEKTPEERQKEAIYDHMKRCGINRDDVVARSNLYKTNSKYHWRTPVLADGLINTGEYYRAEIDDYVLNMKMPEGEAPASNAVYPYSDTSQLSRERGGDLIQFDNNYRALTVISVSWHVCDSILPDAVTGGCRNSAGASAFYTLLKPDDIAKFSTPEKMRQTLTEGQKTRIVSQADMERNAREGLINSRTGNQIVLKPESVVINGRIWIRDAIYISGYNRIDYAYMTFLKPDRRVQVNFSLPKGYSYPANLETSGYPEVVKKSIARMDEMIASLRVSKKNDDGSPDPFVIQRVEPAPLPVREKLPEAQ